MIDTPEVLFSDSINLFFSVLSDNCYHFFSVYRFCYMLVHAGFQAFLFVFHEGIGRQGNDGNRPDIRES